MAEVTHKDPNENSNLQMLIDALNTNPHLSEEYKAAFIKVAVTLDEFLFADFDISKLNSLFQTVKITDFPISEIEATTKDIVPYLLGRSIDTVVGKGMENQALNKGMRDSLVQALYPTERELEDEKCIVDLLSETIGIHTLLKSYVQGEPNLFKQELLRLIPDMGKLNEFLTTLEANFQNRKSGPSKLGEIQKMIIDYFSKMSDLTEEAIQNFSNLLIGDASYFEDKKEKYQSVNDTEAYLNEKLGLNLDGVKTI